MAQLLTKGTIFHKYSGTRCSLLIHVAAASSAIYKFSFTSICGKESRLFQVPFISFENPLFFCSHFCCTSSNLEKAWWGGSSHAMLLRNLEIALKNHKLEEAWDCYKDFKKLYGFPDGDLMSKVVTEFSYSSDPKWLQRASGLVISIPKGKLDLLRPCLLDNLSLSLARAQMPLAASMILRAMLERARLPAVNTLGMIVLHMVNTEIGAYLASNILVEICECANKSTSANQMKPDTMIFNLVLDGCVRFSSSFKGQQIIELMAKEGVIADAHTITAIVQIHEMNCQKDELKKFKDHVEKLSIRFVRHYRQLYESLLNLHFKFNDIDSACGLIMDMCKYRVSDSCQDDKRKPQNICLVQIGSQNLKIGLKLQVLPHVMQKDPVLKVEGKHELILYRNGKLILSNKALAKIIMGYKRAGRISELPKLLSSIEKNSTSLLEEYLFSSVIDACIQVGWLETAHDILEDLESIGVALCSSSYLSLFKAYYKQHMFREAEALLKQSRKAGVFGNMSDEMVFSTSLSLDKKGTTYSEAIPSRVKSDLANSLVRETSKEREEVPFVVNELNSCIYFFMKANMIDDTVKTYKRMQEMKICATELTFFTLISGYSSLGMYREITILWGDIKRNMGSGDLELNRDLYELLLFNFIRGGYFERVMEVTSHMEDRGMYVDKWMYRREFLKYHKNLYRSLKASNAKNEVQSDRIEYVQAFRKWVGIC